MAQKLVYNPISGNFDLVNDTTGSGVSGSGAATQVAHWLDTTTLTGVPYFTFDASQVLRVGQGSEFLDPAIVAGEVDSNSHIFTVASGLIVGRFTAHATSNGGVAGLRSSAYNLSAINRGGYAIFSRSRGTYDLPTIIANDDVLGELEFAGYDGNDYELGARIRAEIDGTPNSSSMPTALVFSATPVGSVSPNEYMRIRPDGAVIINSGVLGTSDTTDLKFIRSGRDRITILDGVVRISGIIEGGENIGQDLILRPNPYHGYNQNSGGTSNGVIRLHGRVRNLESFTPTQTLGSMISYVNNWGTTNLPAVFPVVLRTQSSGKYNYTTTGADPGPGGILGIDIANTVEKTVSGVDVGSLTKWQSIETRSVWKYNAQGAGGTRLFGNYQAANMLDNVNSVSSGLATVDRYYGFGMSSFSPAPINYVGLGVTASEFDAFWCPLINYGGTVGELYGLAVEDQSGNNTITTRRAAVRSSINTRVSAAGLRTNYGLWFPGSASSVHAGCLRIGDTNDPMPALSGIDVAGQIQVGNSLVTVASGVYNWINANGTEVSGPLLHTLFNAPGGFARGYFVSGKVDFSLGNPAGSSSGALFAFNTTFGAGANNRTMSGFQGFSNNGAFSPETFSGITNWTIRTLNHAPVIGSLVGSATHAEYPRVVAVISQGSVLNPTNGSIIINDWTGMLFQTPTLLGTDRVNRITALEIDNITGGITKRSVWSKGTEVEFVNAGGGVFGANSGVSNSSVGLELNSATKAFLPSRLSATSAVSTPIDGMIVYDSSSASHKARQGGAWVEFPGAGSSGPTVASDVVTGSSSEIPDGSDLTCNTVTTTPGSGTDVLIIGTLTWSKSSSANRQVTIKFFKDGAEVDTADRHTLMNTGGAAGQTVTMTGHWAIASESAGSHTYTLRATDDTGGAPTANRTVSRLTVMY